MLTSMRGQILIRVLACTLSLSCTYVDNPKRTAATQSCDGDGDGDGDGDNGDNGDGDGDAPAPGKPELELNLSQVKQFDFEWLPVSEADYYQLLESVGADEPWVEVGEAVLESSTSLTVPLHFRHHARYKLRACNDSGCNDSKPVNVQGHLEEAIGYLKASNAEAGDWFGFSVALAADGQTLAVGAALEDSSAQAAGAAYVFVRDDGGAWSQQAFIKASNPDANDMFGHSVALSGNGKTLAVGALKQAEGDQADNDPPGPGAVYVFARDSHDSWSQQAYVKASNPDAGDGFGHGVALSRDGATLAVTALYERSLNGADPGDNFGVEVGAAYVFVHDDQGTWSQQAYLKASNPGTGDLFGHGVALSSDGDTLAIGALYEDGGTTGIDGNQADESAPEAGTAYVFVRDDNGTWSQQAYVKASNTGAGDNFGNSVALSGDGYTLAVGARREASNASGIDGDQSNNSNDTGAVYVFVRDGDNGWSQQAYVKASNPGVPDHFGWSVALTSDGNILAVGAILEAGNSPGIGGNQADNSAPNAGAVYVFVRDGLGGWSQRTYVKAPNPGSEDEFGYAVALSDDGSTLAVGAEWENSSSMGIGGNQADESAPDAGAAYLY